MVTDSLAGLIRRGLQILKPPPKQTVSQWADAERKLSSEASSEVGQFRTSRAEYQRGMMDACSDRRVKKVVFMTSAQVGKTEILNNIIGYHIACDPGPMLMVQPTVDFAETWSKDRFAPMLRDTPCLRGKVAEVKSRDSRNTISHKSFPGGQIAIVGANSPTDLAGRPVRFVFGDERDRWPISAGTEGDPGKLVEKRTNNFWNRKIVITSTPTVKGLSPIEREYNAGDQRQFYVPCPRCGEMHLLRFPNVVWENHDPTTARMKCPHCTKTFTNGEKNQAVTKGQWVAGAAFKGIASFHINELYSPWSSLEKIVTEFLESKNDPMTLQVFVNTVLGETWVNGGKVPEPGELWKRCENYAAEVPGRVLILTAGVDVQPDRLEIEVVGWAAAQESWSIDHHVIYGDPNIPEGDPGSPWTQLTDYLRKAWKHEIYGEMAVEWTCIDTAGHNTQAVYAYIKRHKGDRFFGIIGRGGEDKPIIGTPQQKRTGKKSAVPITLHVVGVDQAKSVVYQRLLLDSPGGGYCHFPAGRSAEWFEQLTAEKITTKYVNGFPKRVFEKPAGKRNEALDCRVYAFAALLLSAPQFDKIAFRLKSRAKKIKPREATPAFPVTLSESADDAQKPGAHETEPEVTETRRERPKRRRRERGAGFLWQW